MQPFSSLVCQVNSKIVSMKKIPWFIAAFISLFFVAGCKKNSSEPAQNSNLELVLNNCAETKTGKGNVLPDGKICYTKLITDCRCPKGGVCVWQGYAQCEFSINVGGQSKIFRLATLKNILFNTDTTINGTKISLIDVLPYPDINSEVNEPSRVILKIEN
jgi:hypothetical protein